MWQKTLVYLKITFQVIETTGTVPGVEQNFHNAQRIVDNLGMAYF